MCILALLSSLHRQQLFLAFSLLFFILLQILSPLIKYSPAQTLTKHMYILLTQLYFPYFSDVDIGVRKYFCPIPSLLFITLPSSVRNQEHEWNMYVPFIYSLLSLTYSIRVHKYSSPILSFSFHTIASSLSNQVREWNLYILLTPL